MESTEIETIGRDRLDGWLKRLVEEHATPLILIGVGHDHKGGEAVLLTVEEMTDLEIAEFLHGVLSKFVRELKERTQQ